jgi:lipid-binding SYLF domain-containing protein
MFDRKSLASLFLVGLAAVGCSTAPKTEAGKEDLEDQVELTLNRINAVDDSLQRFLDKSAGYVVFPTVGKGGLIVGGSYGRGVLYEGGKANGFADISQASVGLQAGGQTFTEILAFESKADLERFKAGKFAFAATASAVALKSGTGAAARYTDGVAVFYDPIGGAMVEASIGGQSFTYQPPEK